MITRFPEPPPRVTQALHHLQIVRAGDADRITALGLDLEPLPRPWEPATCDRRLRRQIWEWCDSVVAWINSDYVWRPTATIPACWPQHPHLTHELPLLASLRWHAEDAITPGPLEEWHRIILPSFLDRMTQRLEQSSCLTTGVHQDWPARTRNQSDSTAAAVQTRQHLFHADTTPTQPTSASPEPRPPT